MNSIDSDGNCNIASLQNLYLENPAVDFYFILLLLFFWPYNFIKCFIKFPLPLSCHLLEKEA